MSKTVLQRSLLALALCVPLALAACGGDDGDSGSSTSAGNSDETQVRAVVTLLSEADPAVCEKFTDKFLKENFGKQADCVKATEGASEDDEVTIEKVEVDGDKATVTVKDEKGETRSAELVKQDNGWVISDLIG